MSITPENLSNLVVFFSRLNTNNDRTIDKKDNIDERIKQELLKDNPNGLQIDNINESNFDYYNKLYQSLTGKLQELESKGERPQMGLADMKDIDAKNPNTKISYTDADGNKAETSANNLVKEFTSLCEEARGAENWLGKIDEIQERIYDKYGMLPNFSSVGGIYYLELSELDKDGNETGVKYTLREDKGLTKGTGNVTFSASNSKEQDAYYTQQGQFIKLQNEE